MFEASLKSRLGSRFWHQLRCFAYVVHFKSYSKAARYLDLNQPALSKAIQALEHQLKVPLLRRGGRQMLALTPQGDQIYAYSAVLLKGLWDLDQCLHRVARSPECTIRLAMPEWIFCHYFYEPLRALKEQARFKIDFEPLSHTEAIHSDPTESLIRLSIDPCVGWIQKPLLSYSLALYASTAYLKGQILPQHRQDLRHHRCLYWHTETPHSFALMNWHCVDQIQAEPEGHGSSTLIKMAQMGMGIISWFKDPSFARAHGLVECAEMLSQRHAPTLRVYFECAPLHWNQALVQHVYRCLLSALRGIQNYSKLE